MVSANREMAIYCFDTLVAHYNSEQAPHPAFDEGQHPLFVTWKKVVNGGEPRLRGCIGTLEAHCIISGFRDYALTSALRDRRFPPIQAKELPYLQCTVSILTNYETARDYLDWEKIVVKVDLNCCKACPKKLQKALLKLKGVSYLTLNIEENLVSVSGTVHPDTVIKLIHAKLPKKKKLLVSYESQSAKDDEVKPKDTNTKEDKGLNDKSKSQYKGKMHKSCCSQDGNCPKMENNVHKCEEYEGLPQVKDFICRDYFCKIHPRSRLIINKVPESESSARLYGYMPNYAPQYYGGPNTWYPIRGSYYPRRYPERPPAQYEYYQPPRKPQPLYGFY